MPGLSGGTDRTLLPPPWNVSTWGTGLTILPIAFPGVSANGWQWPGPWSTDSRRSSPAASSSGWPSPARWCNDPKLILADEPTGALDSATSIEVMALLQELNRRGITIVVVTHEQDIAAFASRRLAFRDGRVITDVRQTPLVAVAGVAAPPAIAATDATGSDRPVARAPMNFLATLRVALTALRVNKLRSTLTMLGIIIGVAR